MILAKPHTLLVFAPRFAAVSLAATGFLSGVVAGCGRATNAPGAGVERGSQLFATVVPASNEERADLIARARVWTPTSISSVDVLRGPDGGRSWKLGETIKCTFQEPSKDDPLGGRTEKFMCIDESGDDLKIKYGSGNGEVAAEIAASRLLWALGFAADRNFGVRVECKNCPADPWQYITDFQNGDVGGNAGPVDDFKRDAYARGDRLFIPALVEKKFSGEKIERSNDQGWSFGELNSIVPIDPAEKVRREALVLLMGVLQHADSKAEQQRLVCPKAELTKGIDGQLGCKTPVLVVHDLGWTFGSGFRSGVSKMQLQDWRDTPVWADAAGCVLSVHEFPGATLGNTKVSREARDFLLGLLRQLSRTQKENIFRAARVQLQDPISSSPAETEARIRSWADALDEKIAALAEAPCTR
ncbi:MAG: hypothetical protein IOD12_07955 [Silvanigrellales bacterium]|nr:hypothetical protein [Silvanigrellales bacterium]